MNSPSCHILLMPPHPERPDLYTAVWEGEWDTLPPGQCWLSADRKGFGTTEWEAVENLARKKVKAEQVAAKKRPAWVIEYQALDWEDQWEELALYAPTSMPDIGHLEYMAFGTREEAEEYLGLVNPLHPVRDPAWRYRIEWREE